MNRMRLRSRRGVRTESFLFSLRNDSGGTPSTRRQPSHHAGKRGVPKSRNWGVNQRKKIDEYSRPRSQSPATPAAGDRDRGRDILFIFFRWFTPQFPGILEPPSRHGGMAVCGSLGVPPESFLDTKRKLSSRSPRRERSLILFILEGGPTDTMRGHGPRGPLAAYQGLRRLAFSEVWPSSPRPGLLLRGLAFFSEAWPTQESCGAARGREDVPNPRQRHVHVHDALGPLRAVRLQPGVANSEIDGGMPLQLHLAAVPEAAVRALPAGNNVEGRIWERGMGEGVGRGRGWGVVGQLLTTTSSTCTTKGGGGQGVGRGRGTGRGGR